MSDELLIKAQAEHRGGNVAAAEPLYRAVLTATPDHVEALYAFGVLLAQTGRLPQSLDHLGRAALLAPEDSRIGRNFALVLQAAGRLEEAEREFLRLRAREPERPEHRFGLGLVISSQGRFAEAVDHFLDGLALAPQDVEARCNLGLACRAAGRLEEAIDAFAKATELAPGMAKAHGNLGGALFAVGRWADAVAAWTRALALEPNHAEIRADMGVALAKLGRLEEAAECFRHAMELDPGNPTHGYNFGRALQDLGRQAEAAEAYEKVLAIAPDHVSAHLNSGVIFKKLGQYERAVAAYDRVVELDPGNGQAQLNRGKALYEMGRLEEAMVAYDTARRLLPNDADALSEVINLRKNMADWNGLEAAEEECRRMIADGVAGIDPLVFQSIPATAAEQLRCGQLWGRMITVDRAQAIRGVTLPAHSLPAARAKLRLGYISADFRTHAVAHLMAGVFERHDRSRFDVSAYSIGPFEDSAMRRRLEAAFDRFVDLEHVGSGEAARRIHADGIDILVDLTGYTKRCRPEILACRPAPIQVNFLGFTGTMGVDWMDYILTDAFTAPLERQDCFAEKLVHLPHCYMPFGDLAPVGEPQQPRGAYGLPDDAFVYCGFNNPFKFRPETFDLWAGILRAVPKSVLWLREDSPQSRDNLGREIAARGIDPARLVFAQRTDFAEHLARHRHADLFLDCLPYNAHTTACDALWAGLPVLTRVGEVFAGRVAGSLLTALGLPELITRSSEEYKDQAVRLANQPEVLRALRARLEAGHAASPLFSTETFTRNLEKAYARMARRQGSGLPPEAFTV